MFFSKSAEKIIKKSKPAIGFIDIRKPNGSGFSVSVRGTVFAVNREHFLSCYHVYKQVPEKEKQYLGISVLENSNDFIHQYRRFPLELIDVDEVNDIVLLKIKDCPIKFNKLNLGDAEDLREGNEVLYTGFPLATEFLSMKLGVTLVSTKCIISAIKRRTADKSLDFIQIDSHTSAGSSGSPLFLIKTGKVVGLVAGNFGQQSKSVPGVRMPEMMGIVRPINYATKLLQKHNIH